MLLETLILGLWLLPVKNGKGDSVMIGYILTGHGRFSTGIKDAVEMIAGPQENFYAVPFFEDEPLESFKEDMSKKIRTLSQSCDGVVIFSDLMGGTPFQTAMLAAREFKNVEVISGTNLPLLVESSVSRLNEGDVKTFSDKLIETGRQGLVHAQLRIKEDSRGEGGEGI